VSESLPLWAFIAVTLPLVLTPGASTAVVLRNSLAGGVRAGLLTAAGTNTGSLAYGSLTAFGLAVALERWPTTWTALRLAGVGYLAWLGVQTLWRARTPRPWGQPDRGAGGSGAWRSFSEGLATNLLNPSIATFYLILLPQFIPADADPARSVLVLTIVHVALAATWHVTWAGAGAALSRRLSAGRGRQVLDVLTGLALVALAIRL
jgi:threonine/homoserine/homoserine lactone efflux protein